ncbi:MAG: MMPL family transporter [Proteobacteria bacterium]|nr:MMPL family transporter [Pseudomonadota bacterium]
MSLKAWLVDLTMRRPLWVAGVVLALSLFFFSQMLRVEVYSQFSDQYPNRHPYVATFKQYQEHFGGANDIFIALVRRQGDIYDTEFLEKLKRITLRMNSAPGVDHYRIRSIAEKKVRGVEIDVIGILKAPPILDLIPDSAKEMAELRGRVLNNDNVYGVLVSPDHKAALLTASFIEDRIDYAALHAFMQQLKAEEEDEKTEIHITGFPMLTGWMFFYNSEMLMIFAVTSLLIGGLLVFYFRRAHGVLLPLSSALLSAFWGLGFVGIARYNLDPLILAIPFLVTARTTSHSVQLMERFYEEYQESGSRETAARHSMEALFTPGLLAVLTDAAGILTILVISIPLLQKTALFCSFWVISNIFTVILFNPALLAALPPPRTRQHYVPAFMEGILRRSGQISTGSRGRWAVLAVAALMLGGGALLSRNLTVGDAHPGSPILYPDHEYNRADSTVNELFAGSDQFKIFLEGDEPDTVKRPDAIEAIEGFQRHMIAETGAWPAPALPQLVRQISRTYHNADPKWKVLPETPRWVGNLLFLFVNASPVPGTLDPYMSWDGKSANMTLHYPDHKGDTIREVVSAAKSYIDEHPVEGAQWRMAGGLMGVLAAANEEVLAYQALNLVIILTTIFLFVSVSYRTPAAGAILLAPLVLAADISIAFMSGREIGLNVNTLPVQAVGVGIGVDYGIYIIDRIRSEFRREGSYEAAARKAVLTTGLAVAFTATTLVAGVIFWFAMSSLRFQAEMALLLMVVMTLNMLGAVILIPALVCVARPRYMRRGLEEPDSRKG